MIDLIIIVVTYNHGNSIDKCINSLLKQKTDYKYEIHLCDDASTDGTSKICREYARKYPDKIKLFVQKENTFYKQIHENHFYQAIKRINSRYWCYLDGDDLWTDEYKIDIALCNLDANQDCDTFVDNTVVNDTLNGIKRNVFSNELESGKYLNREIMWAHPAGRIHRSNSSIIDNPLIYDSYIFYYYLTLGGIFYIKNSMSEYNCNGEGCWSSISIDIRNKLNRALAFKMCLISNFDDEKFCMKFITKFDKIVIGLLKILFRKPIAWSIWYIVNFYDCFGLESIKLDWIYKP